MSAIGTLVERSTRFLLLIHLERIKSEHVVGELTRHVQTLPDQLRRSVTWDQGKEMALHANFTIDTGVLFADLRGAIGFSSFAVLTYYALANASSWQLSDEERRWPRWLSGLGVGLCPCSPSPSRLSR
jgi:IS30 family transposase